MHASFACADKAEDKRETTNPALASFAFCLLPFALTPTVSSTRQPCWLPNHPQRRRMTALRGRRSELRYPRLLSASGEGIDRQACRAVITVQPGGGCKPGIWTRQKAEGKTFTLAERFAFCLLPSALTLTTSLPSKLRALRPARMAPTERRHHKRSECPAHPVSRRCASAAAPTNMEGFASRPELAGQQREGHRVGVVDHACSVEAGSAAAARNAGGTIARSDTATSANEAAA